MDIIADKYPYAASVTRAPGASAQPRDETSDQETAISIPGGVALSDAFGPRSSAARCGELSVGPEAIRRLGYPVEPGIHGVAVPRETP